MIIVSRCYLDKELRVVLFQEPRPVVAADTAGSGQDERETAGDTEDSLHLPPPPGAQDEAGAAQHSPRLADN